MCSPAERFRNELNQRLCLEGNLSSPNANILLGVVIDGMESNLNPQHPPLTPFTLENILQVSKEIECLAQIFELKVRTRYISIEAIPPLTLQALHTLSLAPTALLNPSPQVVTYITYIAVIYRLSAQIGSRAVRELVKDFNRTNPSRTKGKVVRKVPGVGPRVVKRNDEGSGTAPVRGRKSSLRKRDREKGLRIPPPVAYRAPAREGLISPMSSSERLASPRRSVDQLINAHPTTSPGPQPFPANDRTRTPRHSQSRETMRTEPLISITTPPRLQRLASRETLSQPPSRPKHNSMLITHPPRRVRSHEPSSAPASPTSRSLPLRSQARPFPYPSRPPSSTSSISDWVHISNLTTSASTPKRQSRALEYLRNKLGRISRIYSMA